MSLITTRLWCIARVTAGTAFQEQATTPTWQLHLGRVCGELPSTLSQSRPVGHALPHPVRRAHPARSGRFRPAKVLQAQGDPCEQEGAVSSVIKADR